MSRPRLVFAVPGDLQTATGGYGYDRRIIAELESQGWWVDVALLGDGFPWPDQTTLTRAYERLAKTEQGTLLVIDGLAFGVMPEAMSALANAYPLIALVHHPLALESGLSHDDQQRLQQSETRALYFAKHVIVTSVATARLMPDFGVELARVSVVLPGTEAAALVRERKAGPIELLSVGSLIPRKGFDVLVQALSRLTALDWHLTIVGDDQRDRACAAELAKQIHHYQLKDRITQTGVLSSAQLADSYARSDVFVLASRFEGYGMAYAEAMAHGLPIIGTTGGAISDTVPEQAGLLVAPGDVVSLAQAICVMVSQPVVREHYAQGAWQSAQALPSWADSGAHFSDILTRFRRP